MKALGFALFLVGLAAASGYGARKVDVAEGSGENGAVTASDRVSTWFDAAGLPFLGGLALMILGGVVARRGMTAAQEVVERAQSQQAGATPSKDRPLELIGRMEAILEPLDATKLPGDAKGMTKKLDELIDDPVADFLEMREAMIRQLGLETFAEMIGHFASMERGAARAWSATVDEAWDEVGPSLERARAGLANARKVLEAANQPKAA
ncbi:MAG: hypothetical protein H6722_22400 [Sandaracinus sp.]|nr:hypothetical protein [Sandaracinus sp.]MCB9615197.1 hypothetical protein [Sandaracinus sp.]